VVSSRVEVFEQIRRDRAREGLSVRELAKRYGVHRRAVRQALGDAVPPPRKTPVRRAPKLDRVKPVIDQWLRQDLGAPRKQRHTARRVWERLVDEHAMTELSYSTVRDYVARRRPEVAAEHDLVAEQAFVPQSHLPGAEAEVDFADLWVRLDGMPTKWFLFTLRLSYSGKAVHRVSVSQGQEAFLEGHQHAFETLGGVPADKIRYDNLKSAVSRVLFGRNRTESQRWIAFRSHHGFDAFYCIPGQEGAHEKGGVEGEVGRFRRAHLVPVPEVSSVAELNQRINAWDLADERRHIEHRTRTVGQDFAVERGLLRPLPAEQFATSLTLRPLVDRYARITVRQARYSVPARLIGRRVRVLLGASELVVFDGRAEVARHARSPRKGSDTLVLDHYLEVLARKPGALPGATALAQARTSGAFTPTHEAFWALCRRRLGDADGTRVLVEALLLHRHLPHADVTAGLAAAVCLDTASTDVVAVEARRAYEQRRAAGELPAAMTRRLPPATPSPAPPEQPRVASLTQRRLASLPVDTRPLPSVARYDELLSRAPEGTS
jgi:transposase